MKKCFLFIVISSVIFLSGCRQSGDKTEIKIQLSEAEYLRSLAANPDDSVFLAALDFAQKNYNPETDEFITVFEKKYMEICPDCRLAALYSIIELMDKITYESTNQDVIRVLTEEIKLAKEHTIAVLTFRISTFCKPVSLIDKFFNNTDVSVTQSGKNSWSFTVNRKVDYARLTKLLEARAEFGIWQTYDISEIWNYVSEANNALNDPSLAEFIGVTDDTTEFGRDNPLFRILYPPVDQQGELMRGSTIGTSSLKDTAMVNKYFALRSIKNLFPRDLRVMWSRMPSVQDMELFNLIAVKISTRDGRPLMDEQTIVKTIARTKKFPPVLGIRTNAEGARILSRVTSDNIGRQLVFVIDNFVCFNAMVLNEIEGGAMDLTGYQSADEISDIAVNLGSGSLPDIGVKVTGIN